MNDLWGTLTRTADVGTLRFTRTYPTTIDDLWQAVTDPERLARWFAPVTVFDDGRHLVVFDPDDEQQRNEGEITTCDAPHRLAVTWWSPDDPRVTQISVELREVADGTELTLVHDGLGHDTDAGHGGGWEVYLRQLEQFVTGQPVDDLWPLWGEFLDRYRSRLGETA